MNFSTRTRNSLRLGEIYYLYELIENTKVELSKIPNLDRISITEIENFLSHSKNFSLGQQFDIETWYILGVKFYEGEGVERNPFQAAKLWNRATNLWHINSTYSLAYLYSKGEGVKEDQQKAIELWTIAANKGHEESKRSLNESCSSSYQ